MMQEPPESIQSAASRPPQQAMGDREMTYLLGEAVWLMSRSAAHRFAFMADLDWLVLPPLYLGQVRVFRGEQGQPLVFVSWAFVSEEVAERLKAGIVRLQPTDWRSGPHPWIVGVVAPFGEAEKALAEVREKVFEGQDVGVVGK